MQSRRSTVTDDEQHLAALAMRFRGSKVDSERRVIADEYFATVTRLIHSRRWQEMPPPEDQLPDAWMPKEFFQYWS
jgi:hypothetical protein